MWSRLSKSSADKEKLRDLFLRYLRKNREAIKTLEQVKSEAIDKSGFFIHFKPSFLKEIGIEPKELEVWLGHPTAMKPHMLSVEFDTPLMRLSSDAKKTLDSLPEKDRKEVVKRAIELSKKKGHDYDVRSEDVSEAKAELESESEGAS